MKIDGIFDLLDAAATAYALNAAAVPSPLAGFGHSLMGGPTTRTREPCYLKNHKYTLKKSKKCSSPAPDHNYDVSSQIVSRKLKYGEGHVLRYF